MTNQAGGKVLQFSQLHREPPNISLTMKHGRYYAPLTKYPRARDDKQHDHISPKPYKAQHNEGIASHGHQIDAHLSWETL